MLLGVLGLVVLTGFWWFTIWFLLAGRISWRDVFPAAVATAVFWLGMEAVFSVIFSGMVTSDDTKYGPIGVVFALMSWLIAIGVVIILGAVAQASCGRSGICRSGPPPGNCGGPGARRKGMVMIVTADRRSGARASHPGPARAGTGEQLICADRVARGQGARARARLKPPPEI